MRLFRLSLLMSFVGMMAAGFGCVHFDMDDHHGKKAKCSKCESRKAEYKVKGDDCEKCKTGKTRVRSMEIGK